MTKPVQIKPIPFDHGATLSQPEWRVDLTWPLLQAEAISIGRSLTRQVYEILVELNGSEAYRPALLSMLQLQGMMLILGETAVCLQKAEGRGEKLIGGPAQVDVLRGKTAAGDNEYKSPEQIVHVIPEAIKHAWLRRIARTAQWTPPLQLPLTLLAPEATAISYNALLQHCASNSGHRVAFRHALSILENARKNSSDLSEKDTALACEILDRFSNAIAVSYDLEPRYQAPLNAIFSTQALPVIERSILDLKGLARSKQIPKSIWMGSAGHYPSRAIAIEARRRGGSITTFDHGGSKSMTVDHVTFVTRELTIADRYIANTPKNAECLANPKLKELAQPFGGATIHAMGHFPIFETIHVESAPKVGLRRKVVYAPTLLRGFRQVIPAVLPDVIYLDLQLRIAEAMVNNGVNLVCKPHPEGLLVGQSHPLENIAPTTYKAFEKTIDDADIFLFDFAQTTAFWEAVCTNKPVVFIDFEITSFSEKAAEMIGRRCRVVKGWYDQDNLPQFNAADVVAAINSDQPPDGCAEFRQILGMSADKADPIKG